MVTNIAVIFTLPGGRRVMSAMGPHIYLFEKCHRFNVNWKLKDCSYWMY